MRRLTVTGLCVLGALVTLFGVLAIDLAWRIWVMRRGFDSSLDVALLIALEAVRAIVTLGLVGLAASTARRRQPGHMALAAALLFFATAYANASSFSVFPGFLQERLAILLVSAGTPRALLRILFGSAIWAVPPAVACLLAFAVRYPIPARAEAVRAVHATGRRGMLRDVALAGMDVRSLVHHAAARALELGLFRTVPLTALATAGAVLAMLAAGAASPLVLAMSALAFACSVAFLRTGFLLIEGEHRVRLRRLALAGASIGVQFAASGALSFLPGNGAAQIALALASAAPLVALAFLAAFARTRLPHEELAPRAA